MDDIAHEQGVYSAGLVIPPLSLLASRDLNASANDDDEPRTAVQEQVARWQMASTEHYGEGIYGKVGSARAFVAAKAKVPDWDRLYYVMIRVLSEKYGCFMTAKSRQNHRIHIRCRDKRHVVFNRSETDGTMQFYARQYDREGRELIVSNRRIIARGSMLANDMVK